MSGLPQPHFMLIYRGVDISGDLDPMTTSVTYSDKLHGETDEIEVTVHDKDGRWKGSWYPEHGDTMDLTIFDGRGGRLRCGSFELDEPEAGGNRGGGDTMTIRGLAAPVTQPLRTGNTRAYDKKALAAIVDEVAGRNDLSVEGRIKNLFFERVTQRRERDLEFLTRLGEETGHYVAVRGKRLIVTEHGSIDGQDAAFAIFHGDRALSDYRFRIQSAETYSKAKASYFDQNKKETTTHEETDPKVKTGDTLKISGERMESKAHAEARAKSELHMKNREAFNGSVEMVGTVKLVAGACVNLVGFGRYDRKAVVESSSHTLTRGGYTSSGELKDARA